MSKGHPFQWERQPKAEALVMRAVEESRAKSPFIAAFEEDLRKHTSTRLFDWLDHVVMGFTAALEQELEESGFIADVATDKYRVFYHPGAQLPKVVVKDQDQPIGGMALKVESIADFLMVHGITEKIEGSPLSGYRRARASLENEISLWVVERRGTHTMEPTYLNERHITKYIEAMEMWQKRPREGENEDVLIANTVELAEEITELLGTDRAAWLVLECERKYWQLRNTAGQLQKNRQDRMGMGWANHDHHTFRSSRHHFSQLVRMFEILGFHCREKFYAGDEAGWGAQVMENSNAGLILFLDLDLKPEELEIDFPHQPTSDLKQYGTIGLWCALHGDSILKSGMHHLEAQFLFESLTEDLHHLGVGMMDAFSDFSYLKQAFTHGEHWPVDSNRVNNLVKEGSITRAEADKFIAYGAVGSHLENLQRREGYKGFNQKNVSFIIKKTDPRNA